MYAAEAGGFNVDALLAMIDEGIAFETVLELVVEKVKRSQKVA